MEDRKKNKYVNFFATMIETTIVVPMTYPLDTIKSRLQTNYYNDYIHAKNHLSNIQNVRGLYRGFGFLYTGMMIRQPAKMATFESFNDPFYGGIAAASLGTILGIPLSFIKTNYQTNDKFTFTKKNMFGAWKYEGVKEMVGNVIFLTTYGHIRKYNNFFGVENIGTVNFLNGFFSSIFTTFISYPIDLFKVRKQTIQQNDTLSGILKSVIYDNNKLVLKNLWKGVMPVYLRLSVFGGFGMYMYEKIRTILT